jgi:FtsP/CotA-like multicopper oxidase with cupredoxin domain
MNEIATQNDALPPQLDSFPTETSGLPAARAPRTIELASGDATHLVIAPVVKRIGEATVRMLAYDESIPGPMLRVEQGSEVAVHVLNESDLDATVHWHGLRLDNRFDGTTETQRPIPIGGTFTYRLEFPDPGLYWFHPHIRQDYGQEMGLYGTIVVRPSEPGYWPEVHREITLALDDVLIEDGKIAPFRRSETNYVAMGRFGNVLLVNGETDLALTARRGEVLRLYLVNTANTRVFKVALPGAVMKLVGGDSGRVEREEIVDSVVLAPSERAIVDVLFEVPGALALEHRTPERTYTLAAITVLDEPVQPDLAATFATLRTNAEMTAERARIAAHRDAAPDKTLSLVAELELAVPDAPPGGSIVFFCPMHPHVIRDGPGKCPECKMKLVARSEDPAAPATHGHEAAHDHAPTHDDAHAHAAAGIEWEDDMVAVNRSTTTANTRWKLVDAATGAEGSRIDWRFRVGDQVKIRLVNTMESDHPMHHPFHVHGAGRFLILARDGMVEPNLVWKDTVLVRTGETIDILLDVTNAGRWMAHCHIAEHHESGMMLLFDVDPRKTR